MVFIDAFEVPPEADEEFLGHRPAGLVLRALRRDVALRFAVVGGEPLSLDVPFPRVGGAYEVVAEDGDVDGAGGVIAISLFSDDAGWAALREFLAAQRGYIGTRLYRGDGEFRFVEYARWSSPLMLFRATNLPAFAERAIPARSGVYERLT